MKIKKQRFLTFFRLPGSERLLFLEALSLHLWVGLLLKFIPFKKIPAWFANPSGKLVAADIDVLEKIKAAGIRATVVSPWKNKCLITSLATRYMLKRRKIESQLYLGLTKTDSGKVIAHAWLVSGNAEVVEKSGNFTELFVF